MFRLLPLVLLAGLAARADKPAAPDYVDDDQVRERFTARLGALAEKAVPADKLRPLAAADRAAKLSPAPPADRRLDPEDVFAAARPSVLLFGSVVDDNGTWADGRMATAWVLAADGVLVTNWHVLDQPDGGERFGAMTADGRAFPLVDVLAVNKAADIAVVRVAAAGLAPLPLARQSPRVGAWVGVLGHPGDRFWTFTQGHVARYTGVRRPDAPAERWMSVTAEYAYGSSGSPVLDRTGAVVGMAALTESLDYPLDDPMPPADAGSRLQMVVKLVTPLAALRRAVGGE